MLARGAYRLIVTRTGHAPARLAAPDRVDTFEIVSIDDMEVVLFWDIPGRATSKLEATIRNDLDTLEAEEFYGRWAAFDPRDVQ